MTNNPDNKILNVTNDVTWIGVLDPGLRTFDVVMETKDGTTYNSYFINADKKTVVDTVKAPFWDTYLEKLKQVTNPEEIEYIIASHTEPDHSGNIGRLLEIAKNATVVSSGNGIRYLADLVGRPFKHIIVKPGDELDLGNKKLQFINAANLHWPDSILTYLPEDKLLFTCDVFGEHYCNEVMFDDLAGNFDESFRYYFDVIMSPFSKFMMQAIQKVRALDIDAICTGHGMILRGDWKRYINLTEEYCREYLSMPKQGTVLIAYVSAYHNTGLIANMIAEGVNQAGPLKVDLCDIEKIPAGEIHQKIMDSSAIILGCPTFSQNILMPVYQVFALINPIRDRGKPAAAFGSYGWSGEGPKLMSTILSNLKLDVADDGLMVKFTPHDKVEAKCIAYGLEFGKRILAKNTKNDK
jgi:NADH oxidase (H2O-forming)